MTGEPPPWAPSGWPTNLPWSMPRCPTCGRDWIVPPSAAQTGTNIPTHQPLVGIAGGAVDEAPASPPEIHPEVSAAIASIARHVADLYAEAYQKPPGHEWEKDGCDKMAALADRFTAAALADAPEASE